jgi:hypothetical protein
VGFVLSCGQSHDLAHLRDNVAICFQAMRRLLAAAAVASTALVAISPAEAKSIWLKCGFQEIHLDSAKKSFSLTWAEKVYQGGALFSPEQIVFSYPWFVRENMVVRSGYFINRKSLEYERAEIESVFGTPWVLVKGTSYPNPEFGKCSIMKNQI